MGQRQELYQGPYVYYSPLSSQHPARWLLSPFYKGSERLSGLPTNQSQGVAKGGVTPFILHHTPQPLTGWLWSTLTTGWEEMRMEEKKDGIVKMPVCEDACVCARATYFV